MKKAFKISIPDPCTENWDHMQPRDCSRFCTTCEKMVVDFTKFNDEEFISFFQNTKIAPCGHINKRQLSIEIPPKYAFPFHLWNTTKYIAAGMMATITFSSKAFSKENTRQETWLVTDIIPNKKLQQDTVSIKVRGLVLDSADSSPIIACSVKINQTSRGTLTDIGGNFELVIPIVANEEEITLQFNSLGYLEKHIIISAAHSKLPNILLKKDDSQILDGVIIYTRKPSLWNRLTKPFRKKKG